jgi:hypothetical protein
VGGTYRKRDRGTARIGDHEPKGLSIGDLIDRYIEELYPDKKWGRSKSADLARLKKELGSIRADKLNSAHIVKCFRDRHNGGAGPVTISAQAGYLVNVLRVARCRLERCWWGEALLSIFLLLT